MLKVTFLGEECEVNFHHYTNGRICIRLDVIDPPEPMCTATTNIPGTELEPDEVIIKDYSENDGILDILQEAGIISKPIRHVMTGFALADVCKLLVTPEFK